MENQALNIMRGIWWGKITRCVLLPCQMFLAMTLQPSERFYSCSKYNLIKSNKSNKTSGIFLFCCRRRNFPPPLIFTKWHWQFDHVSKTDLGLHHRCEGQKQTWKKKSPPPPSFLPLLPFQMRIFVSGNGNSLLKPRTFFLSLFLFFHTNDRNIESHFFYRVGQLYFFIWNADRQSSRREWPLPERIIRASNRLRGRSNPISLSESPRKSQRSVSFVEGQKPPHSRPLLTKTLVSTSTTSRTLIYGLKRLIGCQA